MKIGGGFLVCFSGLHPIHCLAAGGEVQDTNYAKKKSERHSFHVNPRGGGKTRSLWGNNFGSGNSQMCGSYSPFRGQNRPITVLTEGGCA
jgi:hypothetical protein